jgi:hypothetical protein
VYENCRFSHRHIIDERIDDRFFLCGRDAHIVVTARSFKFLYGGWGMCRHSGFPNASYVVSRHHEAELITKAEIVFLVFLVLNKCLYLLRRDETELVRQADRSLWREILLARAAGLAVGGVYRVKEVAIEGCPGTLRQLGVLRLVVSLA